MRDTKGCVDGQLWYDIIGVLARTTQGAEIGHEWSSGYDGYTYEETQSKVERQLAQTTGATTCAKLAERRHDVCKACPHRGKLKSPISLGIDRGQSKPGGRRRASGR
jgi:hypothetical protein